MKLFSGRTSKIEGTKFPPVGPEENAFRGLAAVDLIIQDVLAKGAGELPNAMRRYGLPGGQAAITFRWGRPGEGIEFKGGSGLSHIIAKHGVETVEEVVNTIAKGRIVPRSPDRVNFQLGDTVASVVLESRGKRETWVLTGFTKNKPSGFFNLRELSGPIFFNRN